MSKPLETAEAPATARSIQAGYEKRLMLTAGRASRELGGKIAERLNVELIDAGLKTFADGEVYCRYAESIRGADLFVVQSICGSEREGLTVNDALWELLLMVHAAKHASAHRIIAVTPWYGYSRQDKKSAPREPISARLVADTLEVAGIDRLVTMDLHAGQLQGFFSKPVDHMTAMPILTQFVTDRLGDEDLVIIAPDAGRVKLVRNFAQKVGAPYALMEKERPAQQVAEIGYVIGDVKDRTAVIVDDIIGTGSTLSAAAQTVLDAGAKRVFAVATHGLFSGQAFDILQRGPLDGIVVTDTVPLREGAPDLITQLSCADILEDSIRRIFIDDSVSEIFAGENQLVEHRTMRDRLQALTGVGLIALAAAATAGASDEARVAQNCVPKTNVEAIVDDSGSMSFTDPDVLRRRAMELFIDNPANGRRTLGAIEFGTDAQPIFAPALISQARASMKSALTASVLADNGLTDYNDAFAFAQAQNPNANARIFLTDGGHSNEDGSPYANGHRGGPPVYVIGLGVFGDNENVLKQIASESGGLYRKADSASALQSAMFDLNAAVSCLAAPTVFRNTFTSQGQTVSRSVRLPAGVRSVNTALTWDDADDQFDITRIRVLRRGKVVARGSAVRRLRVTKRRGETNVIVRISRLIRGRLAFRLRATRLSSSSSVQLTTQLVRSRRR